MLSKSTNLFFQDLPRYLGTEINAVMTMLFHFSNIFPSKFLFPDCHMIQVIQSVKWAATYGTRCKAFVFDLPFYLRYLGLVLCQGRTTLFLYIIFI